MIISHKYKFIFLHVPKVAGTSIKEAIKPYCDVYREDLISQKEIDRYKINKIYLNTPIHHLPAIEMKKMIDPGRWNSYFKFAFVRNPYDWAVSNYFYILRENSIDHSNKRFLDLKSTVEKYKDFNEFSIRQYKGREVLTQAETVLDGNDNIMVDFLGNYENIQNDFEEAMNRVGLKNIALPHENKGSHEHYSKYYNEESKDIVKNSFKKELRVFGYDFNGKISHSEKKIQANKFKLVTSLYNEKNESRANEYKECLKKNLENPLIDSITVFYDISKDDDNNDIFEFLKKNTVNIIIISTRPTYRDFFNYANSSFPKSKIIVANGDIYFNDTLSPIKDLNLSGIFFSLTRWNVTANQKLEQFKVIIRHKFISICKICNDKRLLLKKEDAENCNYNYPCWQKRGCKATIKDLEITPFIGKIKDWSSYSQDAWIFQAPLKVNFTCGFKLGTFHCDSFLNYHLLNSGLRVYNPSNDIQACHLHLTNIRDPENDKLMEKDVNKKLVEEEDKKGNKLAGIDIIGMEKFYNKEKTRFSPTQPKETNTDKEYSDLFKKINSLKNILEQKK